VVRPSDGVAFNALAAPVCCFHPSPSVTDVVVVTHSVVRRDIVDGMTFLLNLVLIGGYYWRRRSGIQPLAKQGGGKRIDIVA